MWKLHNTTQHNTTQHNTTQHNTTQHNTTQHNRIIYADILRILASFSVIVLHVSASYWHNFSNKFNWNVLNVYDSLVRWAVPVFIMISGMMFLDPSRQVDNKKIIRQIFKIIIALIFWGLLYNFYDIIYNYFVKQEPITIKKIILAVSKIPFGPAWYHLWYLYTIIGLYFLVPIYRVFTKNATEKNFIYLLVLFFLFGFILPFLKKMLPFLHPRFQINFSISQLANYSAYFFAGYYFSKYHIKRSIKFSIYFLAILSFAFTILGTAWITYKTGKPNESLYGNLLPTTMLEAFAIFLFVKSKTPKIFCTNKGKLIYEISRCTFGIYLVHDLIKVFFRNVGFHAIFINPIFAVPLVSCFIFIFSLCIVYLIRKIPILKIFV